MNKTRSPLALGLSAILLLGVADSGAATLLDDHFNDGTLASNTDTGGGFIFLDNSSGTAGSVSESGSQARILDGNSSNTSGILSSYAFDLSNSGLSYTTTWEVANWTSGSTGTPRRTFFTLQTHDDWIFSTTDNEASRIILIIDELANNALFRYQNRSAGTVSNFDSSLFDLGTFAQDTNGFTVTLILDSTGFNFTTAGLSTNNQVSLSDTWANLGTDFATVFGADGPMHVTSFIQDQGTTGSSLDIDRITLASNGTVPGTGTISLNFHSDDAAAPGEHQLTTGETAGFVPVDGADWNNISVGTAGLHDPGGTLFPSTPLKDSTGSASAATISPSAATTWFTGYCATSAGVGGELNLPGNQDDLFNSYLGLNGPGGDGTPADAAILQIGGIGTAYTSGGYSLILYSDTDKGPVSGDRTSVFTVTPAGGSPIVVLCEDDSAAPTSTFNGSYVLSDNVDTGSDYSNYTVIEGLTASSFTLEITSPGAGGRGGLSGFQIVAGTVLDPNLPVISSFTADATSVSPGTQVQLSWNAPAFDTLTLDPGGIDAGGLTTGGIGSTTVTVNAPTTYILTATRGSVTVQSELTVFARVIPNRPNVLVFLVDDMGVTDTSVPFIYDGSGNPVNYNFNNFYVTPNMETMASRGMKFTQAYATPACSSTRASLMTGFNTPRHGVVMQINPNGAIAPNAVAPFTPTHSTPNNWKRTGMLAGDVATCMPKVLKDAGYRTIFAGKGHFGSSGSFAVNPTVLGFDVNYGGNHLGQPSSFTGNFGNLPNMDPWENQGLFLTEALTLAINGAIETAVNDGVPFFAYMSHYAVHTPFTTDPNASGNYSSAVDTNHARFATMIEGMDQSLGGIIAKLEQLEIAENTLIVFLGDNGSDSPASTQNGMASGAFSDFPLRGKKATGWEGGVRVPMLVSWAKPDPGNTFQTALPIAPGSRQDDIVTVWDVFPTVLEVTDTTPPHPLGGHDLSPYLQGLPGSHRPQEMLIYWPNDHNNDFFALYRDENWKLIYRFASDSFELYDLDADPTESNDLAAANPDRVMAMARAMAREFEEDWGASGRLWPTFDQAGARPYVDDPLLMPSIPTVDTDGDGIPDNGEDPNSNGLVDPGETDPDASDTDKDGTKDGAEVRTGTDPLNPGSFFKVTPTVNASGNFIIQWPSKPGARYKIESSETLNGGWAEVEDDVPADAVETTTDHDLGPTTSPDRNFFRVILKD